MTDRLQARIVRSLLTAIMLCFVLGILIIYVILFPVLLLREWLRRRRYAWYRVLWS